MFQRRFSWAYILGLCLILLPCSACAASGQSQKNVTKTARASAGAATLLPGLNGAASKSKLQADAQVLLDALNRDRAVHRLAPLTLNARQSRCSKLHSKHMATIGAISHDQFPADVCIAHLVTGENVGVASGDPASAVLMLDNMMIGEGPCLHRACTSSEHEQHGHYLNIMNPTYRQVGVGIAVSADGKTWLTEDFTN